MFKHKKLQRVFPNTDEKTSRHMSQIKSKCTNPENVLKQELDKQGYNYLCNVTDLLGKPDIVLQEDKIAIFIDGEFWHGKNWHERVKKINSNKEYWRNKIKYNIKRDKYVNKKLRKDGWTVLRFWESDVLKNINECIKIIKDNFK